MTQSYEEKRSSPRIFFENTENIAASINGSMESFYVDVLNLSSGGLQFSQKRTDAVIIKPGDQLNLVGFSGISGLQEVSEVAMEVRWIIDQSFLGVISAGCQFVNLADNFHRQIEDVVSQRLNN